MFGVEERVVTSTVADVDDLYEYFTKFAVQTRISDALSLPRIKRAIVAHNHRIFVI